MMSKTAAMLNLLADALENGTLGGCDLRMIARTLEAVPEEYHKNAVRAALGADKAEDDAPEDYAVVKTFDSSEFHVGDEVVTQGGIKYFVIRVGELSLYAIGSDSMLHSIDKSPYSIKRTGRNFPAIAAILEEIRK